MADTFVKKPKLIVGTQAQVGAEMGANDIGFATDVEFYTTKQIDELLEKSGGASLPILMPMWSDHVINDMSWLRADTFSWQSGDMYVAAYEHLTADFAGLAGTQYYAWTRTVAGDVYYTLSASPNSGQAIFYKDSSGNMIQSGAVMEGGSQTIYNDGGDELTRDSSKDETVPQKQTDTIGDITISYYLADDGHKICLPDQESNISALYEATGVAWYFILDTDNKQFKLPRTKWGFTGLRDSVGGYVPESLPNVAGSFWARGPEYNYSASEGAFKISASSDNYGGGHSAGNASAQIDLDASLSSPTYQNGAPVQPKATQMYLYFYVGYFEQSAIEQTAGLNAELFNGKADVTTVNGIDSRVDVLEGYDYVVESQLPTADNGYTWYRKYKSGWVEQGGGYSDNAWGSNSNITFAMPMVLETIHVSITNVSVSTSNPALRNLTLNGLTSTGFSTANNGNVKAWFACGIAA